MSTLIGLQGEFPTEGDEYLEGEGDGEGVTNDGGHATGVLNLNYD